MDLRDFTFVPLPPIADEAVPAAFVETADPLGPLALFPGLWKGTGFNTIWRPFHDPQNPNQDRFLELNLTDETLEFDAIGGRIPNRGLLQADIFMFGLTYLQKINDHNLSRLAHPVGLHVEPGVWAVVPPTTDPKEPQTVVRMGSIPHGTTIHAQGTAQTTNGAPAIPKNDVNPVSLNGEKQFPFPEQDMSKPTPFRSSGPQVHGITQAMVDDPNSVLTAAIAGQTIVETTTLSVSTHPRPPITGGGTGNTAFLRGAEQDGRFQPNADATLVTATFWIERVRGGDEEPDYLQLQYTQTVMLQFRIFNWPT
jgi:hypothetical protein